MTTTGRRSRGVYSLEVGGCDGDPLTRSRGRRAYRLLQQPPKLAFHAILIATALVVLWAYSFPGVNFLALVPCLWIVGASALTWIVRAVTYVRARRGSRHEGSAVWFSIAPIGAIVLALLLYTNGPLRIRWQFSKSEFQHAVVEVDADPGHWSGWDRRKVGSFTITYVHTVRGGIIFYEETGAFVDDAGFAYLPDGPSSKLTSGNFENPHWFYLGDHWYAWTASW